MRKISEEDEEDNTNVIKTGETEMPIRQLVSKNPNSSSVIVQHNLLTKELERTELVSQLQVHYRQESHVIMQSSDDFKLQEEAQLIRDREIQQVVSQYGLSKNSSYLNQHNNEIDPET